MADINRDRFYLVDPGIGEKSDICPYSVFEDGRDVKAYIIPPDGYELSGFKFEPYDSPDHFYEGKVVAQFVKEKSFMEIARPHLWKYITALVAVIGIIVGLILFFGNRNKNHEVVYVEAESASTEAPATVDNSIKTIPTETVNTENVTEEAEAQEAVAEQEAVAQQEVVKEEPLKEEVVKEEKEQTDEQQLPDEQQLSQEEMNAQFKEEFWALIHKQEKNMALYGRLFRAYKDKVECAEFKYMVKFILRNTSDFRAWNENLLSIPSDEIKNVSTIDQLTTLMEEYE